MIAILQSFFFLESISTQSCLLQPKRAVNRAARIAAQCEPGQVCVGVPMGDGEEPPDPGK